MRLSFLFQYARDTYRVIIPSSTYRDSAFAVTRATLLLISHHGDTAVVKKTEIHIRRNARSKKCPHSMVFRLDVAVVAGRFPLLFVFFSLIW